ncbi:MAG TPA: TolC family outer membrane protein [Gammaproteobacteria bacterium]|jgi:outer membrane protein|nr:TolC family outer membrane protein [Gammaproteobacteria bacterium]
MRKTTLALTIGALLAAAAAPAQADDLWDVYQQAVQNDPTFLQAYSNYQAQQENAPIARGAYFPNITLSGRRTVQRSNGDQPQFTSGGFVDTTISSHDYNTVYTAQLTQAIFDWTAWSGIEQASAQVAQAEANFQAAQQDLILRVATAYFDVLNARDTLAADHAAKDALSKQLEQAKEKYEVGMSAITDVQEAQAAYDQAVADEITAQQQVVNAEESLRAITGHELSELKEPSVDMPLRSPEPNNAQQWVDQALKQNPNLLAAQSGADAASAAVGVQRGQHLPNLSLVLSHNKNDDKQNGTISVAGLGTQQFNNPSNFNTNTAYLQLSWPIWNGGSSWARVNQAQYQYQAALDNVKLATRQTEQQARTAFLGVLSGISQVEALKQSVKSNETSMDATETGLQVGTRTIVDVLTARQNLLKAQTSFANARYTYLKNVLTLKQAAGILTENDVKQMNVMLQESAPASQPAMTMAPMGGTMAAPASATSAVPAAMTVNPPESTPPR